MNPCEHRSKYAKGLCRNCYVNARYRAKHPPMPKHPSLCEHEPKKCKGLCRNCYARALYRAAHPPKPRHPSMCAHEPKHGNGLCLNCYNRAWDRANPEKVRERVRTYCKRKPEKKAEWKRNNPEKVREHSRKRRALKQGCTEHFTEAEFQALKRQLGNRCVGCWKTKDELKVLGRKLVPDHIVAVSKGGLDDITNIQPLCQGTGGCNNKKSAKYLDCLVA
jgi:HNH endonuclease